MATAEVERLTRELARELGLTSGESEVTLALSNGNLRRAYLKLGPLRPAELDALDPAALVHLADELRELARRGAQPV